MTVRSLYSGFSSLFKQEVVLSCLISSTSRYWFQVLESVYHTQRCVGTLPVFIPKTYPKTRNQVLMRVEKLRRYVYSISASCVAQNSSCSLAFGSHSSKSLPYWAYRHISLWNSETFNMRCWLYTQHGLNQSMCTNSFIIWW